MKAFPYALAALVGAAAPAFAAPVTISHEGRLLDENDAPAHGPVKLTFRLYKAATGDTAVWTGTYPSVQLAANGLYQLQLGEGDTNALDSAAFDGADRWIGITVGDGTELSPRLRLGMLPVSALALSANDAKALGGHDAAYFTSAANLTGTLGAGVTYAGQPLADAQIASAAAWSAKLDQVAAAAPLSGTGKAGDALTLAKADATHDGYLAKDDFARLGRKLDAVQVAPGGVLSGDGTASAPLAVTIANATAASAGLLSAADKAKLDVLKVGDLRGSWTFDEQAGTVAHDQSGAGNDLTKPESGVTWFEEPNGGRKVMSFLAGANAWLQAPSSTSLQISDAITVEAWVYPKAAAPLTTVVGKAGSFLLSVNNGQVQAAVQPASATGYSFVGSGTVPLNAWSHVAMTYDGFMVRTFVNQVLTSETSFVKGPIAVNNNPLTIGGRTDSVSELFNGLIDDVRVTRGARTFQQPMPQLPGKFATITARATVQNTSPSTWTGTTQCPTGYSIIYWGARESIQFWGGGMTHWYATCAQSGNGVLASLYTQNGYAGHYLECIGLCAKN